MIEIMKRVPFVIKKNGDGTYAIIENPTGTLYGSIPWYGECVLRSPFDTAEAARERMAEIAKHYEYESYEVN